MSDAPSGKWQAHATNLNARVNYQSRVAEKETAEWKRRFDLLLERTPKEPKP